MSTATYPTARPDEVTPERRPYQPRGAALRLLMDRSPEVLISGPAGTGKSRAALEKIHCCCDQVPGCRALILRQTRESLTESALVTWEQHVLPAGHPALVGPQRRLRQSYRYPNGSEVVVGGLDKPSKVMSTEYDLAYIMEAIEVSEDAWESVTTRLRNHKLPFQQLLADTNPDRPSHWLRQRCTAGKTLLLESRHEDNPTLWDGRDWTPRGRDYIAKLDALTGPRRERLRFGRWVQAEGVVYEGWDRAKHLIPRFPIPLDWPRYWSVDFGYTNPFVCQWWAQDPDGRLFRYREIYRTQRLVEDHAKEMLDLLKEEQAESVAEARQRWEEASWPEHLLAEEWAKREEAARLRVRPRAIICDHDAEGRATLEKKLGMPTVKAIKDVSPGIQAVAARLCNARDGRPRLFLLADSLVERDAALWEARQPCSLEDEVDGYIWDTGAGRKKGADRKKGEEPVKIRDHACDAMRYLVANFDLGKQRTPQIWV